MCIHVWHVDIYRLFAHILVWQLWTTIVYVIRCYYYELSWLIMYKWITYYIYIVVHVCAHYRAHTHIPCYHVHICTLISLNQTTTQRNVLPTPIREKPEVFNTLSLKGNTQYGFRARCDVPLGPAKGWRFNINQSWGCNIHWIHRKMGIWLKGIYMNLHKLPIGLPTNRMGSGKLDNFVRWDSIVFGWIRVSLCHIGYRSSWALGTLW